MYYQTNLSNANGNRAHILWDVLYVIAKLLFCLISRRVILNMEVSELLISQLFVSDQQIIESPQMTRKYVFRYVWRAPQMRFRVISFSWINTSYLIMYKLDDAYPSNIYIYIYIVVYIYMYNMNYTTQTIYTT